MELFENHTEQPKELAKICNYWQNIQIKNGLTFKNCKKFLKEVENIGFTFEFGLDSEPFNLKKI